MSSFKSDLFSVNASAGAISEFIGTPSNLFEVLPQERVENWRADGDFCSFKIKGLAHIELKLSSKTDEQVIYTSASEKPFAFTLSISIGGDSENSNIQAAFNPEVNAFMATMLKTPMTNFLNHLGEAIKSKYA